MVTSKPGLRPCLGGLLLAAMVVLAGCSEGRNHTADDGTAAPLNILLLSLDTTRADNLSCYGYPEPTTPNLDELAAEGIIFEEAFSSVPITLPAHASMLTGLYPFQHGVRTNGIYVLGEDQVTLAELLSERGYDTGAVMGAFPLNSRFGLAQGFNYYDDEMAGQGSTGVGHPIERSGSEVTRLGLEWLDRNRSQPFFLWCHYFDPHAPYEPPEPYRSRFGDSAYRGEIAAMDAAIGDLLDGLRNRGLWDSTIVVVVGDHGESLGEHDELTHAFFIYDATLKVPMIFRFPATGRFHEATWRGRRLRGLVNLTDILPTVGSALGLELNREPALAGQSLLPMITGDDDGHDWLYHESLVPQLDYGASDLRSLRRGSWKFISAPRSELYDLRKDPGETENLASSQPDRVMEMGNQLQEILKDQGSLAAPQAMDPETLKRLRSLGYVAGGQSSENDESLLFDPKDLGGYAEEAERAFVYSQADREPEALALVDSLLAVFSEPVFVHQLRGKLLLDQSRPEEAVMAFDEALSRCGDCPQQSDLLLQRATAIFAAGRPDEALAQAEVLVARGETKFGLRMFLSEIWVAKGDLNQAGQALSEEADLWPNNPLPLLELGELEMRAGRPAAAEEAYRELLSKMPTNVEALVALSEVLDGLGREAEASEFVARVLALEPSQPWANVQRGLELEQEGRAEEAVDFFETAMRQDPTDPLAATLLGSALARMGRTEEAIVALDSAIATGGALPEAYSNLGAVYYQLGRYTEAVAVWEEGIKRDPEGPYAEQMSTFARQARQRME